MAPAKMAPMRMCWGSQGGLYSIEHISHFSALLAALRSTISYNVLLKTVESLKEETKPLKEEKNAAVVRLVRMLK